MVFRGMDSFCMGGENVENQNKSNTFVTVKGYVYV